MSTKTSHRRHADRIVRRHTRAGLAVLAHDRGCRTPRRSR